MVSALSKSVLSDSSSFADINFNKREFLNLSLVI